MIALFAIALELRLAGLCFLGLVLGAFVNWAVYRLAWNRRSIGPWQAPAAKAPPRQSSDRLPLFGWLGLRREAALHGRGFWIRPLLVEMLLGLLLPGLYFWETQQMGLLGLMIQAAAPAGLANPNLFLAAHMTFLGHAVLLTLMFAVSLIDFDEKTIPDSLTTPGTLFGLTLAGLYPWSLLPDAVWAPPPPGGLMLDFMRISAPNEWPAALNGWAGLSLGLACWWGWIFALLRRRWILRRGWAQAWRWFCARLARDASTRPLVALGIAGSLAIGVTWLKADTAHWSGLLSSLVGAAAGGGIVWLVRLIGSATLGRGSDGVRRCDLDGDDRRLGRLAGGDHDFLSGPVRRPAAGNRPVAIGARQRNSLWTLPVPGGGLFDRRLGPTVGRDQRPVRIGLAVAGGSRYLFVRNGGNVARMELVPQAGARVPLEPSRAPPGTVPILRSRGLPQFCVVLAAKWDGPLAEAPRRSRGKQACRSTR